MSNVSVETASIEVTGQEVIVAGRRSGVAPVVVINPVVPIPDPNNLLAWAEALTDVLTKAFSPDGSGLISTSSSSTLRLPIRDGAGRIIVDLDGLHIFDKFGFQVVDANIVNIDTAHLVDAAIVTSKLATAAVNVERLAALAVEASKLAANSVTTNAIADLAITTPKILDDAITTTKITNDAVTTPKIVANAITSDLIIAGAVIAGKIATNAIVAGDGVIAVAAIGTALIANAAITEALIGNAAIVEAKIGNLAVTDAKIFDLAVQKLTAGTIAVGGIFLGSTLFELDGLNKLMTIKDNQGTPVTRVKIGKLGAGATDYGLQVFDSAGSLVFGQATSAADILNVQQVWSEITGSGIPDDFATVGARGSNLLSKDVFTDNLDRGGWANGNVVEISSVGGVSTLDGYTHAFKLVARDNFENSNIIPVTAGETIYWGAWINTQATTRTTSFGYRQSIAGVPQGTFPTAVSLAAGTDWTWLTGSLVVLASTTGLIPFFQVNAIDTFGEPLVQELVISRTALRATVGAEFDVNISGQIDSGNVSTYIANAAILNAQIGTLDAGKINTGFLSAARIAVGSLDGDKITTNTLTALQIAANTITASEINTDAITTDELAANSITAAKGQISDLTVETLKIQDDAVTIPVSAFTSAEVTSSLGTGWFTVQTVTITSTGQPIEVLASAYLKTIATESVSTATAQTIARVRRTTQGGLTLWDGVVDLIKDDQDASSVTSHGCFCMSYKDTPGSGTVTYVLEIPQSNSGTGSDSYRASFRNMFLLEVKK